MMMFEAELKRNPLRTLSMLAARSGVDIAQLAGYQPNAAEEAVLPLRGQIEQLKELLAKNQQGGAGQAPAQTDEDEDNPVAEFMGAKDEKGAPKYPHFQKVAPVMGMIMLRDGHEDLEKAYNEAVHTVPEYREALGAGQKAKAEAEQKKAAELAKAKRAASLKFEGATGGAIPAKTGRKNVFDIINEAQSEIDAR
jgi:hypothetical protein